MWSFSKELALALGASAVLVGCGGVESASSTTTGEAPSRVVENIKQIETTKISEKKSSQNATKLTDSSKSLRGYYLDSEVKGVTYSCGKYSGKTGNDGLFLFEDGEDCEFELGGVSLRTIEAEKLYNGITIIEDDLTVARVLQTMDIDNNPENGIDIESEATECLNGSLPKSEDEFANLVECLNSANIPDFVAREYAVTAKEAKAHLERTKESLIPKAKSINLSTKKDTEVKINILAENPRSDMLKYEIVEAPKHGTLEGKAPSLVYVPDSGFVGSDSFSYTASNRRFKSNVAKVTIQVREQVAVSFDHSKVVDTDTQLSSSITVNQNDNVVIYNTSSINSNGDLKREQIAQITKELYKKFRDDFDFIFIVSDAKNRTKYTYSGLYFSVKNDTRGIGKEMFDYSRAYGSEGRLQGVIHFPSIEKFDKGPKLHELLHRWGNSVISWRVNGRVSHHWGYNGFDRRGQLGGFEMSTLRVEEGNFEDGGVFSADTFGTNANGGDGLPYSSIELYLMGLISADEVGDVMLTTNASFIKNENGRTTFKADRVEKISFAEYLNNHSIPQRARAEKESFRVLTVLLTNSTPSAKDVKRVDTVITDFAKASSDDVEYRYNLYEATNGKLHLDIDNLSESLR